MNHGIFGYQLFEKIFLHSFSHILSKTVQKQFFQINTLNQSKIPNKKTQKTPSYKKNTNLWDISYKFNTQQGFNALIKYEERGSGGPNYVVGGDTTFGMVAMNKRCYVFYTTIDRTIDTRIDTNTLHLVFISRQCLHDVTRCKMKSG